MQIVTPETVTAELVAQGYDPQIVTVRRSFWCDECRKLFPILIQVGCDDSRAELCQECVEKAAATLAAECEQGGAKRDGEADRREAGPDRVFEICGIS